MTPLRGAVVGVKLEEGLRLLSGACGESSFGEEAGHVVRLRRELVKAQLFAHRLPDPLVVGTPGLTIGYKDVDSDMCYGFLGEHPASSPLSTAVACREGVAQEGHQRLHARHLGEDTPPERSIHDECGELEERYSGRPVGRVRARRKVPCGRGVKPYLCARKAYSRCRSSRSASSGR